MNRGAVLVDVGVHDFGDGPPWFASAVAKHALVITCPLLRGDVIDEAIRILTIWDRYRWTSCRRRSCSRPSSRHRRHGSTGCRAAPYQACPTEHQPTRRPDQQGGRQEGGDLPDEIAQVCQLLKMTP